MAQAFKCDSCGEYHDGHPMTIHLFPPTNIEKVLKYELCPFCANEVINIICREKVFGDLD